MAKVKITGHASGTGILTVTAPNTSTDRTITLPDATGTLLNSDGAGASLTALNATQLTSGTVPTARLGSGTASSSVFLSGANTWISAADSTKLPLAGGTLTGNLDVTMTSVGDGIDLIDTHTAHGITDYLPTNASLRLTEQNDTEGGGRIIGATDNTGQHGLSLYGLCQDSAVATVNNIQFVGAEKSGTGIAAVANDKSVFKFFNNSTTLLDIKGDGRGLSQFTAKAWTQFTGTGTVAIDDSHNVSSITDLGEGKYQLNFANNMANANYAMFTASNGHSNGDGSWDDMDRNSYAIYDQSTSAFKIAGHFNAVGGYRDSSLICALVFGD